MVVRVGERFFSLHLIVGHQSKKILSDIKICCLEKVMQDQRLLWQISLTPAYPLQTQNHISLHLHKQKFFDFKELFILLETNTFFW